MFQGWKITGLGLFGNFMIYGGLIYMMNVFLMPIHETRGWSITSISYAMGLASFCVSLGTFMFIYLTFHFKLRTLMTLGSLIGGLGFFAMGFATNYPLFVLAFCIAWASGQLCGGAIANILVSNWFDKQRGRALGITNIGTSLSGVILPFFCLFLVNNFGLEIAFATLGTILLLFTPICYFLIRDYPEDLGLLADNAPKEKESKIEKKEEIISEQIQKRKKEINMISSSCLNFYRDRNSFCISVSYGLALMGAAAVIGQLKPGLQSMGLDGYYATLFVTLVALFGACGKYFWGYISDMYNPVLTTRLIMLGNIISLAILLLPINYFTISLFTLVFGLCMGGMWPILATLIYYFYGKENFKKAYQYASVMIALKAFGYMCLGFALGLFGSYKAVYVLFTLVELTAFLIILTVKKEEALEYQIQAEKVKNI